MRTGTPTTPIIQMHQKQMPQPTQSGMQQQTPAQHNRSAVGIMAQPPPPHMQLPQFQNAQQQQQSVNKSSLS